MRRHDGPEPFDGIVCPQCFEQLAEQFGVIDTERTGWHVHPDPMPDVPLTDADGRVWDAEQCLWVSRALAADSRPPEPPDIDAHMQAEIENRVREKLRRWAADAVGEVEMSRRIEVLDRLDEWERAADSRPEQPAPLDVDDGYVDEAGHTDACIDQMYADAGIGAVRPEEPPS